MTIMVIQCGCLDMTRAEDGKLHSQLEWPYTVIKTHGRESRGQEEAGCTRRTSELFTGSTAVNFVNALNKPPLKAIA